MSTRMQSAHAEGTTVTARQTITTVSTAWCAQAGHAHAIATRNQALARENTRTHSLSLRPSLSQLASHVSVGP